MTGITIEVGTDPPVPAVIAAPGATEGDVLTVQDDGTLAVEAGGGSQPPYGDYQDLENFGISVPLAAPGGQLLLDTSAFDPSQGGSQGTSVPPMGDDGTFELEAGLYGYYFYVAFTAESAIDSGQVALSWNPANGGDLASISFNSPFPPQLHANDPSQIYGDGSATEFVVSVYYTFVVPTGGVSLGANTLQVNEVSVTVTALEITVTRLA